MERNGLLILAGPSCTGKTTIARHLASQHGFSVFPAVTTRPARTLEGAGEEYRFVSEAEFTTLRESGQFLFWDELFGYRYGVESSLDSFLSNYRQVVLKVPVWRLAFLLDRYEDAVGLHLLAPELPVIAERLALRGEISPGELHLRLEDVQRQNRMDVLGALRLEPMPLGELIRTIEDLIYNY
jgi:guanylate kinase